MIVLYSMRKFFFFILERVGKILKFVFYKQGTGTSTDCSWLKRKLNLLNIIFASVAVGLEPIFRYGFGSEFDSVHAVLRIISPWKSTLYSFVLKFLLKMRKKFKFGSGKIAKICSGFGFCVRVFLRYRYRYIIWKLGILVIV